MRSDHPWMTLYRQSPIILCVGQGALVDDLHDPGMEALEFVRLRDADAALDADEKFASI